MMRLRSIIVAAALGLLLMIAASCGGPADPPGEDLSPTATPTPLPTREATPAPGEAIDVRAFGATGDGSTDDSAALQRALDTAASTGALVGIPAGTYRCATPLELADGVTLRGEGEGSWLKGQLVFASRNAVEQLKIGDAGTCAVTHADGAAGTVFRDCRLRGGGGEPAEKGCVLFLGGSQGNVRDVLFERCTIERTLYEPPPGEDAWARGVGNTITINEFGHLPDSGHVEGITFRDCHLGASNGTATGALRMMMEAFTWSDQQPILHGWKDLTFDGCTIEASDTTGLDFADGLLAGTTTHSGRGVLVTGCTFLGARLDETWGHGGLPIVYECPTGIVIRDNFFHASPQEAIGGSWVRESTTAPALLIEGNTFDMTTSPAGLTHQEGEPIISLVGYDSRVLNNSFRYDSGYAVRIKGGGGDTVFAAVGNLVRGNTFTDMRTMDGEPTVWLADDYGVGNRDNHITANTIHNRAAGSSGVVLQSSGTGTNYATDNVIDCGDAVPFVVVSGKVVQRGNRIIRGR
jgi:hypothetical protein